MAKICPETNEKVLYIECIECETKTCRESNEREEIDMQTFRKEYSVGTKGDYYHQNHLECKTERRWIVS